MFKLFVLLLSVVAAIAQDVECATKCATTAQSCAMACGIDTACAMKCATDAQSCADLCTPSIPSMCQDPNSFRPFYRPPSKYNSENRTCTELGAMIVEGMVRAGITTSTFDCSSTAYSVAEILRQIGQTAGCCSDGKSKCHIDYSAIVCKDPAKYNISAIVSKSTRCDDYFDHSPEIAKQMPCTGNGSSFSFTQYFVGHNYCCTDKTARCQPDVAGFFCMDPSKFNKTEENTCLALARNILDDKIPWNGASELSCASDPNKARIIRYYAALCCSNSMSRCPTDSPTTSPTDSPTTSPTKFPTRLPTNAPTLKPTRAPSLAGFQLCQDQGAFLPYKKTDVVNAQRQPRTCQQLAQDSILHDQTGKIVGYLDLTKPCTADPTNTATIRDFGEKKGCCADGKSKCYIDQSAVCLDPAKYVNNAIIRGSGGTPTPCGVRFNELYDNKPFSTSYICRGGEGGGDANTLQYLARNGCCSDQKSFCFRDVSRICQDPTQWKPDSITGTSFTCEIFIQKHKSGVYYSPINSTVCSDQSIRTAFTYMASKGCCSGMKSICETESPTRAPTIGPTTAVEISAGSRATFVHAFVRAVLLFCALCAV
eukprot:CAMPEP_0175123486 /NCGR_PEP_ID=MMETSP0087-20121206/2273_1 /TAXON_ID=136419 /ORGANISM="Unknown Unknown, Strain D1" /LENGTH=594 /DNA_ID=CAMNT_0016405189 /DNA_START=39 /DNA_END=1823 /DNA_ORIENTATION=+